MSPTPTDTDTTPRAPTNGKAHAAASAFVRAPAHGNASTPRKGPEPYAEGTRIYRGRSIEELVPRIEAELGADAIVLRRRSGLAGGVAGFFQTPFVEIEARPGHPRVDLYDGAPAAPRGPATSGETPPPPEDRPAAADANQDPADAFAAPPAQPPADTLANLQAKYGKPRTAPAPSSARTASGSFAAALVRAASNGPSAFEEISTTPAPAAHPEPQADVYVAAPIVPGPEPQADVHVAAPTAPGPEPQADVYVAAPTAPGPQPQAEAYAAAPAAPLGRDAANGEPVGAGPSHPRARAAVQAKLRARGVEQELAEELIATAAAHELALMPARSTLAAAVQTVLRRRIPSVAPLPAKGAAVAFVGPGGAGKTSCCAALLRAYGKRSDVPVACASVTAAGPEPTVVLWPKLAQPTPLGDRRAERELEQARADGLLLFDMPAVAPGERRSVQSLAALLSRLPVDRVVLALPATWGAAAAAQLLDAARPLRAGSLAITHADSTDQLGVAVEVACRFGLAPEFLFDSRRGGTLLRTDPHELAERMLA